MQVLTEGPSRPTDAPETPRPAGAEANAEWQDWSTPKPRDGVTLDLGQCVAANGASNNAAQLSVAAAAAAGGMPARCLRTRFTPTPASRERRLIVSR